MTAKKKPRVINMPTLSHLTYSQQQRKIKNLSSEVKIYNMYDDIENIPSLEEIEKKDFSSAKKIIETVRSKHPNKTLAENWGVSDYYLYKKLYPKYDIETNKASVEKRMLTLAKRGNKEEFDPKSAHEPQPFNELVKETPKLKIGQQLLEEFQRTKPFLQVDTMGTIKQDGWQIELRGIYSGEEVFERLLVLENLFSKESNYKIFISIQEQ